MVKLLFIYQKAQKLLNLRFYKAYINDTTMLLLPEIEYKSSINTVSPQLVPNICMANMFNQALIELLESQFISSPGLFNNQYNYHHTCKVIAINKEFGIYPSPYYLDTFSPPIVIAKAVDKVAFCYLWLLLAWVDDFYKM